MSGKRKRHNPDQIIARLDDELLAGEEFTSLAEARFMAGRFKHAWNHERPSVALGYRTPAEFASSCVPSGSATLRPQEPTAELEMRINPNLDLIMVRVFR